MSKYNFDELVNRKHSQSYKWDVKDNELPMWVADMDFHMLPDIKVAIQKRLDIDAFGYCGVPKEYYESYKNWWKRRHDVDIDIESMVYSEGVVASIDSILKHIVKPGSGIIVQSPVYHVFYHCIENNGHFIKNNQLLYKKGQYCIDFDGLEALLKDSNNRVLLLCNPHNPVGRIWDEDELKRIVNLCKKYNVLLISDEIHCDIAEPGHQYNSILKYSDDAIALLAPSKAFNLAGLKSSVVVTRNKELLKQIQDGLGKDDLGEPNYFACDATIAAFNKGDEWIDELNQYLFNNKKYIQENLKKNLPDIHLVDNKATYLLWLDISKYTSDSKDFADELRKKTGLFLSNGKQFGRGGESFLRMNIATSLDNVKDACDRLYKFIKNS